LIGSIRRECVDHIVVLGEAHLRRILGEYAAYYNESRTHRSLGEDAPVPRQFSGSEAFAPTRSLAASTTITSESRFSVHTMTYTARFAANAVLSPAVLFTPANCNQHKAVQPYRPSGCVMSSEVGQAELQQGRCSCRGVLTAA
jgi:hypothetical protein